MPSEEPTPRTRAVPDGLSGARESFRAAVAAAAEQVRGFIVAHSGHADGLGERAARELGPFAAGRIDLQRFGALFNGADPLDARSLELLGRAQAVLSEVAASADELFLASVPAGGDLCGTARAALAHSGRAFGAARVVELVRGGRFQAEHEEYLTAFPPAFWTRAERLLAPPLVLEVAGADLQVGGLAELLQGAQKIALLVKAPAPPAPLVRLITPGTFVLQTTEAGALGTLAGVAGAAVAAVLPGGIGFVHDPAAGPTLPTRLSLGELPAEMPRTALGHYSAAQQVEEVQQLAALAHVVAAPAPGATSPGVPAGPATTADRLAAWLLQQSALPAA